MNTEKQLTQDQISTLSEIILDQLNDDFTCKQIAEIALSLFEDIAGLECINESEQQEIIHDIWADIHERKT